MGQQTTSVEEGGEGQDGGTADDARSRILAIATGLFAQKGYAGTSIREITQAAGVTNPMVYYYFGSKAGLFEAILLESVGQIERRVEATLSASDDFRAVLVEVLTAHFEMACDNPAICRMYFNIAFGAERGPAGMDLRAFDEARRSRVEALIEAGKKRKALAQEASVDELMAVFSGILLVPLLRFLAGWSDEPLDRETAERLVDRFLLGAAPRIPDSPTPRR